MIIKTELGNFELPEYPNYEEFGQLTLERTPHRLVEASRIFDIPVFKTMASAWLKTPTKLDFHSNYLINLITNEN